MAEHMIDILRDLEALKKWDELINTRLERRSLNNTRGVQTLNYYSILQNLLWLFKLLIKVANTTLFPSENSHFVSKSSVKLRKT